MANFDNIIQEINTNLPDNNTQAITAAKLRTTLIDLTNTIDNVQDDFETNINNLLSELPSSEVTINLEPDETFTGQYYNINKILTNNENWSAYKFELTDYIGKTVEFTAYGGVPNAIAYFFIVDSNNNTVVSQQLNVSPLTYSFEVTSNMRWLLLSNRTATAALTINYTDYALTVADQTDVDELSNTISKLDTNSNVIETNYPTLNNYFNIGGTATKDPGFKSIILDLRKYLGKNIEYTVYPHSSITYILVLNEDTSVKSYISVSRLTGETYTNTYTPVVGDGYLCLSSVQTPIVNVTPIEAEETFDNTAPQLGYWGDWINGYYYTPVSDNSIRGCVMYNINYQYLQINNANKYVGKTITINAYMPSNGYAYIAFVNSNNEIIEKYKQQTLSTYTIPQNTVTIFISNRYIECPIPYILIDGISGMPSIRTLAGTDDVHQSYNNLSGKKISFIGDSITAGTGASSNSKRYSTVFTQLYNGIENNLGVAGTCIASSAEGHSDDTRFVARATAENLNGSSLIVIFGGTNDFSYDSAPIGDLFVETSITPTGRIGSKKLEAPTNTAQFGAALHNLIQTVRNNCQNVPIVLMTPLNRGNYNTGRPASYESNVNGNYLYEFVDAIKKIGAFYSIPVLDLSGSEMDLSNPTIATNLSTDSLHPNDKGHNIIANLLFRFVENNIII